MRGLLLLLLGLVLAAALAWALLLRRGPSEPEHAGFEVRRDGVATGRAAPDPADAAIREPGDVPAVRRAPVLAVYDESEPFPDVEEDVLVRRHLEVPEGQGPVLASEVLDRIERDGFYHLRTIDRALLERLAGTRLEGLERGQAVPYAHLQAVFQASGLLTHRPDPRKPYLLLLPEGASLDRWIPRPEPPVPAGG
jgi:hypothetical protein